MLRMFPEHKIRSTISLDGIWSIRPDDQSDRCFSGIVPGIWNAIPALAPYRGKAVYSKEISIEKAGNLMLRFGGVSHTADVYLDGQYLGHHYDAFTGFRVIAPDIASGSHTVSVHVDNSFSEESSLHIPNDYYSYGGLTRPVEVNLVPDVYIDTMAFNPVCDEDGNWTAHVTVCLKAIRPANQLRMAVRIAGQEAIVDCVSPAAGESASVEISIPCGSVTPWNPMDAHLYTLEAVLYMDGIPVDDLIDRVGFRMVKVCGEDILINGKTIYIKGFNRHEDYGSQGCAIGVNSMMEDLQLMMDMGVNSVRTCHYPNDPRFLDLCDELGILVWEESHARAIPGEIMRRPNFQEQIDTSTREMVTQHRNHPCIYTWGLLNECESDTEFGRGVYSHIINILHEMDASRPVTFASCRFFNDICLDLVDIASFNIYPLWYHEEEPASYGPRLAAWMDENGAAGKPILFSEFGAGGIAGYHDPLYMPKWSEERQAAILDNQLGALGAMERISGTYIWQFADVRVSEEWAMIRPKAQNNKGVVDMYRHPKLSYAIVKKHYTGLKR